MKKTIWQPVVMGIVFGLLAGISITAGLSFVISNTLATSLIGFHVIIFLLSAAFGGPLAGFITPAISVIVIVLFGSPEYKEILSRPNLFWTNMLVPGMVMALAGFAYRFVFDRVKMPSRLLPWAGIVITYYVIEPPIILSLQYYFGGDTFATLPSAILSNYQTYIPQVLFVTSLVFIALPSSFAHPLWYESRRVFDNSNEVQNKWKEGAQ